MDSQKLIKLLKQNGWEHARTQGSHHIFEKKGHTKNISVPHPKKDLDIGIVKGILKKAGL